MITAMTQISEQITQSIETSSILKFESAFNCSFFWLNHIVILQCQWHKIRAYLDVETLENYCIWPCMLYAFPQSQCLQNSDQIELDCTDARGASGIGARNIKIEI